MQCFGSLGYTIDGPAKKALLGTMSWSTIYSCTFFRHGSWLMMYLSVLTGGIGGSLCKAFTCLICCFESCAFDLASHKLDPHQHGILNILPRCLNWRMHSEWCSNRGL